MGSERVRALYAGNVQGVGFRWRVVDSARPLSVKGFVRNLADGRVEMVAEGERPEVEGLLAAVRARMAGLISDEEIAWSDASGEFRDFAVRR
jgi:acylphosphatase